MALLSNKMVVITGAGNGIGRAVAELFATQEATLLLNDIGADLKGKDSDPTIATNLAEALRSKGCDALAQHEDISTQAGVENLMAFALKQHGRIDVLVNCAGILRERALLNSSVQDLATVLNVHVIGTFRLMQAAAIVMRDRNGGRIINTTSNHALSGNTGQSANSAASAAIVGLTRTAAVELVRHGIFVNAVAPLAKTRQTEHLPLFQKIQGLSPEHVAPAYLFLASDLSADLNGEIVTIAGSKLSRLVIRESDGEYSENDDGRFDAVSLATAWRELQGKS